MKVHLTETDRKRADRESERKPKEVSKEEQKQPQTESTEAEIKPERGRADRSTDETNNKNTKQDTFTPGGCPHTSNLYSFQTPSGQKKAKSSVGKITFYIYFELQGPNFMY